MISKLIDKLISKIAVFSAWKSHKWFYKSQCKHCIFFKIEDGATITVNEDTYWTMITDFLYRYQIDILRQIFDVSLFSCNGDINWPPRSCDLTLINNFLLAIVKEAFEGQHCHSMQLKTKKQRFNLLYFEFFILCFL